MKRALIILALLGAATDSIAQDSAGGAPSSPLAVTPRVKTALSSSVAFRGAMIDVESAFAARTVTLRGTVVSAAQKALAGEIAGRNAPGWKVVNRLVVRAAPRIIQTQAISPSQKIAGVPLKYKRAAQFLQLLARSQGRGQSETFGGRKVAFPDVKRVLSYVSSRGVTIVDVNENHGRPLVLSRTILGRDLKRTGSSAFDSFAYVGYIYNLDYSRGSQLSCTPTKSGVIVEIPSGHRFTWTRENGRLQLRKLEYLRVEGD